MGVDFFVGIIQKIVVADNLAIYSNTVFDDYHLGRNVWLSIDASG